MRYCLQKLCPHPAHLKLASLAVTFGGFSRILGLRAIGELTSFGLRPGAFCQVPSGLFLSSLPHYRTPVYYDMQGFTLEFYGVLQYNWGRGFYVSKGR